MVDGPRLKADLMNKGLRRCWPSSFRAGLGVKADLMNKGLRLVPLGVARDDMV